MSAVEVERLNGGITGVARGVIPTVDLQLKDPERVVSVSLRQRAYDDPDGETVNWTWSAYVCRKVLG